MNLRRRYITQIRQDRVLQKCLALTLMLKDKLKSSRIHHYSTNKLCQITGISHKTAQRYEDWLLKYGFAHFEGAPKDRVLIINKVSSHTTNRNIRIDEMDFSTFFSAYRSVQSFIFMRIQHNKDYLKHLLQARHNPNSPKEFRTVRRKVKDLVEQGRLKSADQQYKELGLSLEKIAKEVGCCIRTVQRVVEFAVTKAWVEKEQHFEWFYAPHVNHRDIPGFTFTTNHKLCIVHPNTYTLSSSISQAISY